MAITVSSINPKNAGSEKRVDCVVSFGVYSNTGNDNTTGELLLPAVVGMTGFSRVVVNQENGYQIEVLYSQSGPAVSYPTPVRFKVLQVSAAVGGNTSSTSGGTPSGTINAQNFAGNALAGHSHTFTGNAMGNHSHLLTWQEDAAIPVVANVGNIVIQKSILNAVYATVGGITGPITIIPNSIALASGQCHFDSPGNTITFFAGDAITECKITGLYIGAQSASAGVPSGSIDSVSAGTPSGTVDQAVFAGDLLATHNHTYGGGGGGSVEVPNGTNLSASLGSVQIICYGV
jgi:hypothetical protein